MPRAVADAPLTTRAARERLAARHQPYWRGIDAGSALGYRKGKAGASWLARAGDAKAGGGYRQIVLGRADDVLKADGAAVLDYRQAESKAREWIGQHNRVLAGLEAVPSKPAPPYTVGEAMADYLAEFAARGGRGVAQTRQMANAHILPAMGGVVVSALKLDRVKEWHRALAAAPARIRSAKGAKRTRAVPTDEDGLRRRRATANRILTVLKAALNHARADGRVTCSDHAWAAAKPFREADAPKVRYLSEAECSRLVNACAPDFRRLVVGALLTGCRYGELAAMRVADFDADAGIVTVARSKSGKPRHVVLTDEGRAFFARQTAGNDAAALIFQRDLLATQAKSAKPGTRKRPAQEAQPATRRRGPWGKSQQFRMMREACDAANITPAVSFHITRHCYASRLASRGASMAVIAAQLGHSDTRMTERHYAHLAPSYITDTVRQTFGTMGIGEAGNGTFDQ